MRIEVPLLIVNLWYLACAWYSQQNPVRDTRAGGLDFKEGARAAAFAIVLGLGVGSAIVQRSYEYC